MSKHPLDEFKHFSIHEDDFKRLSKDEQDELSNYEPIVWSKLLKKKDRTKAFLELVKEYKKVIDKNNGKESNEECHVLNQMTFLLERMMAHEIRKLNLEKLLK